MTEADVERFLVGLALPEPSRRAYYLRCLAVRPHPDPRLLVAAEALLTDTTLCVLCIPYELGEIRYLAAQAVVALRHVLGIPDLVALDAVLEPLTLSDLGGSPSDTTRRTRRWPRRTACSTGWPGCATAGCCGGAIWSRIRRAG